MGGWPGRTLLPARLASVAQSTTLQTPPQSTSPAGHGSTIVTMRVTSARRSGAGAVCAHRAGRRREARGPRPQKQARRERGQRRVRRGSLRAAGSGGRAGDDGLLVRLLLLLVAPGELDVFLAIVLVVCQQARRVVDKQLRRERALQRLGRGGRGGRGCLGRG